MMAKRTTTHTRIEKETLEEYKLMFPNMKFSESSKFTLNMYKGIQKTGKFLYGKVWKK